MLQLEELQQVWIPAPARVHALLELTARVRIRVHAHVQADTAEFGRRFEAITVRSCNFLGSAAMDGPGY